MTALVELRDLAVRYPAVERNAVADIFAGIDLEIEAGDALAVLGPSGCGKSTLLNVIGGLLPPTAGSVRFAGTDLATLCADELAALRNREIGFIFQAHHLLPQCTALENVLVPTLVGSDKSRRRAAADRARALLTDVGLGERCDHRPAQLSGGECQRVAVVRALINQPRLLLADEPTGSLDAAAADQLAELLVELNQDHGVAMVTVTHSARLAGRMHRVLELRGGALRSKPLPS